MSIDKPSSAGDDRGDQCPDRADKPFPGAPADLPPPPPLTNVRTWDEIRADRAQYKNSAEYDKAKADQARKADASGKTDAPAKEASEKDSSPAKDGPAKDSAAKDSAPRTTAERGDADRPREDSDPGDAGIDRDAERNAGEAPADGPEPRREVPAPERAEVTEAEAVRETVPAPEAGRDRIAVPGKVAPDSPSETESLRRELAEAKAENARLHTRVDGLESTVDQILKTMDEPSAALSRNERESTSAEKEAATRAQDQRRWLPSDTANNLVGILSAGGITDLAYHYSGLSPEMAGIGATGVAAIAGGIAWWRERRKR